MAMMNTREGWGWPARVIHWTMAVLILFMTGLGLYMANAFAPGDLASYPWFQLHKSWGFVVFVLAALRLAWRLVNRETPELPPGMPGWERFSAQAVHVALYLLILAIPVTGWLMVSASPLQDLGVPNRVFGLFDFPDPFRPGSAELAEQFRRLHVSLWIALMATLVLHVGGAVKHHFIARDSVLRRMIVGG
ncbi:MAG TPA: cytochrome b [Paracoccaceae bacterium]|nr:cytochrome b [Paracoccaceae bacterium]